MIPKFLNYTTNIIKLKEFFSIKIVQKLFGGNYANVIFFSYGNSTTKKESSEIVSDNLFKN